MMQRAARVAAAAGLLLACGPDVPEGLLEQFRSGLAEQAAAAARRHSLVAGGLDDWLFLGPELRHVAAGRFWGSADRQPAARSDPPGGDPAGADPLPAILDFKRQLDARGVELLLVPVPPKSIIYPEKAAAGVDVPIPVPRLDAAHEAFYGLLREQGVDVLDLTDHFLANRFHPEGTPYCRRDSHWSGVGCVLAGEAIAAAVRDRGWYPELATTAFTPRWYSDEHHRRPARRARPPGGPARGGPPARSRRGRNAPGRGGGPRPREPDRAPRRQPQPDLPGRRRHARHRRRPGGPDGLRARSGGRPDCRAGLGRDRGARRAAQARGARCRVLGAGSGWSYGASRPGSSRQATAGRWFPSDRARRRGSRIRPVPERAS